MLCAFILLSKKWFINGLSVWFSNVLPDRFKSILNLLLSLLLLLFSLSVFANKLFVAVTNHDTEAIRQLIATGADVNIQNGYGNTPLHEAIYNDFTEGAYLLINAKANVNIANQQGMTAFHVAAFTGNTAILTHLLHDIDNINLQDGQGNTIFHLAARKGHMSCVKLLVNYKENIDLVLPVISDKVVCLQHADIDINIKNNDGNTPLHLAATGGCCGCLSWLLTAKNIDVDAKNNNEFNPIGCAVATGHTNCVELLMKVCSRKSSILDEADFKESSQSSHLCISSTHDIPANTKNKQDDVFCSAIKKPNKIYADALSTNTELQINIADDSQYSPSSLTTVNGGDACIERDSQSAHINTQNISEDATNPEVLQCAVSLSHCTITDKSVVKTDVWGNTALHKAAAIGDIEYIWQRLPFMTPDEVNARNNNRETALHKCSLAGHTEFIKCLLTVPGLEINATDVSGNTAVHNAVYANFPECLQLLIDANADTNIDDNYQNTALHYAVDNSRRCISKLIPVMKPERVNFCNKSGFTAFNKAVTRDKKSCISLLLTFSCVDINVQDKHGNTPLHNALIKSSTVSKHSVKILLNKNADVHIRNEGGSTVLHAAVGKKPEFIEQLLQKLDIDFINRKDIKGRTALHRAAAIGDLESIKKLRSAGADILLEDNQGAQAFYSACINGYVEIVRYFLESCKDRNGQHLIDINCQDDFGNTPLYGAGRNGHRDVFSYLIRKGADRTLKNKFGHSPILFDEEKVSKKTLIGLRLPI